jgi:CarboxypepD_reg-like domain
MSVYKREPKSASSNLRTQQALSAKSYAVMALVALLLGVGLLVYYIHEMPQLDTGARNQVYYVVLFPSAIACAAALFGAIRSYAILRTTQLGATIELGGPVVLFALILWGAYKLVPSGADTFDLTIRAHSDDGATPLITSGQVMLELGADSKTASFSPKGEADFKAIPAQFMGRVVRLFPQVEGYEEQPILQKIEANFIDISLKRHTAIAFGGSVQDENRNPLPGVDVMSPDCDQQALTNEKGAFAFKLHPSPDRTCRFIFRKMGYETYDTKLRVDESLDHSFLLRRRSDAHSE